MSLTPITGGFLPLLDAGPILLARELGFAEEEGLDLRIERAASWSALRDMLAFGTIDAASMLSPVPVATALGIGGLKTRIDALQMTSLGGSVIAVSCDLAARMRAAGYVFDFTDVRAAGAALLAASGSGLRIGIPFPFSMHAELLYRWLGDAITVQTVPPPLMAEAIAAGEIDAFCVGEPWGSVSAAQGVGELLLPGSAIWRGEPDKVLAMRHDQVEAEPQLTASLMRAVWRAGRWLGDPENHMTASEILARPDHLDTSAEMIERLLSNRLVMSRDGGEHHAPQFIEFFAGVATFPWRSQAAWIGTRLAARFGLDPVLAKEVAQQVFRTDLYRANLGPAGADLPAASARLEGAVSERSLHPAAAGKVILLPDQFFDGAIFDPDRV